MPGAMLAIWCDAHAIPKLAAALDGPALHRRHAEPGPGLSIPEGAGARPPPLLPHLPFVLPALFAGSTLGLFLFGKVSDLGFRRAISALLFCLRRRAGGMKILHVVATVALAVLLVLQASPSRAAGTRQARPVGARLAAGMPRVPRAPSLMGRRASGQLRRRSRRAALYRRGAASRTTATACRCARRGSEIIATHPRGASTALRPEADRQDFKGMVLADPPFPLAMPRMT